MPEVPIQAAACPYCLAAIAAGDDTLACPACKSVHHRECWEENGENRRSVEIPVSHWGQEHKPCPACGKEILAAALRCRHCGATFASAQPENTEQFQLRTALAAARPELRTKVRWIFFVSIFPFTAPIGAIWGWWWQRENPDLLASLPPIDRALAKIALIAAIVQTAAIVILTALYSVVRG